MSSPIGNAIESLVEGRRVPDDRLTRPEELSSRRRQPSTARRLLPILLTMRESLFVLWLICKGTVPIPGAKNGQQAEQNAGALGWRLSAEEVAALDRVAKPGQRGLLNRIWQHG